MASAEDRAIEPGDPRVCDVDGRVGVCTVDGAIAARPRECAPRGELGVDKKDPAFLNFGRGRTFRKTVFLPEAREGRQRRADDAIRRLVERIYIYKSLLAI